MFADMPILTSIGVLKLLVSQDFHQLIQVYYGHHHKKYTALSVIQQQSDKTANHQTRPRGLMASARFRLWKLCV